MAKKTGTTNKKRVVKVDAYGENRNNKQEESCKG